MTAQRNGTPSGRRTGRTGRTRRALGRAGAALVALCALATGCSLFGPDEMRVVWDTPADRKGEPQGNGAWLAGDTLVRSRFDAVRGYDASSGRRSWEYVPPGRSAVCHAAADTDGSVLVLTRDRDGASATAKGEPCATAVAIDMANGRVLWERPLSVTDPALHRLQPYTVSAGGGIAVLLTGEQLRAVDARTGKPRWKAALPKGCVPGRTATAKRHVAALLACGGTGKRWDEKVPDGAELHAAAFAPDTGALLWSGPLGDRRAVGWDAAAAFVSADPVVVAASESSDSDFGAYFSFGGNGRPNPPIDFKGSYGEIGRDRRLTAAVGDGRLYVLPYHRVRISRFEYRLTAFDLATGEPVWGGALEDDRLDGETGYHLQFQDGKLLVLATSDGSDHGLRVLDPATAEQREARDFPDDPGPADTLFVYKDRIVVARYGAYTTPPRPFTAYARD
ncbi:outer membrane protein assembly factor BamB family protein [Streptomyces sp. enrichment culture]|uniref:outer membrane protein assembly factor BamB family protein n=1 Tax=Streptomyces sp. enrichment culture TaxID=1795815 RepID=UPI003F5529F9